MKKILLPILGTLLLASCATTRTQQETKPPVPVTTGAQTGSLQGFASLRDEYFISADAKLTVSTGSMNQSGKAKILTAGSDSLQISITGPFGIFVGRLFARANYFMYYDALNNELIEGNPSGENLKKALRIPVAFEDIMHILRGEVLLPGENYSPYPDGESSGVIIFSARRDTIADYAAFSGEYKNLLNYQRKISGGDIFFNVNYRDYRPGGNLSPGRNFPHAISVSFPGNNSSAQFELEAVQGGTGNKRFSFGIPEGAQRRRLD